MKKLTRDEMKKVMGGVIVADDKACQTDSDCGRRSVQCGNNYETVDGHCHNRKCSWNLVC